MTRTFGEMALRDTHLARFRYLALDGVVGEATFGYDRHLNQKFYTSREWRTVRDQVIIRDNGCDLGVEGHHIHGPVLVHHMNPIALDDIVHFNDDIINPEYLISVSRRTHNAIHFGDEGLLPKPIVERRPGDTRPW